MKYLQQKSFARTLSYFVVIAFACSTKETTEDDVVWHRHAIDNTLLGADGARFDDANGDKFADIVTGWEQSGVTRIYFNPVKDSFTSQWKYVTVGSSPDVEDAVLVDLDGDGAKDVVTSSEGDTKRINIHWAPSGTQNYYDSSLWSTAIIPSTDQVQQWMFALPAQIDNKFGTDLIVAGKKDNDTFPQPYMGWLEAPEVPRDISAWVWRPLAKVAWVMSVFKADINGDNEPDIIYSDRKGNSPGVKWLENPGKKNVTQSWKYHAIGDTTQQVLFMALDDLDSDGKEDVVVVTEHDGIHFFQKKSRDGKSWKLNKIKYPERVGLRGKGISVADINNDGKKDIVLSFEKAGGPLSGIVYLTYRESVFDSVWVRHEVSGPEGIKYDLTSTVDIDADGDLDIISTEENNNSQGNIPGLGLIWYENPLIADKHGKHIE